MKEQTVTIVTLPHMTDSSHCSIDDDGVSLGNSFGVPLFCKESLDGELTVVFTAGILYGTQQVSSFTFMMLQYYVKRFHPISDSKMGRKARHICSVDVQKELTVASCVVRTTAFMRPEEAIVCVRVFLGPNHEFGQEDPCLCDFQEYMM